MVVSIKTKRGRDRLGNLYDEELGMIELSPAKEPIDDMHFWCIVCKEVKSLNVEGGVIGSYELGGWLCQVHLTQSK